jgi:hypothetical protein
MSLHAVQCALAAVFTETRARERFLADETAFAREYSLDAREMQQLTALTAESVAAYSAMLLRKRRGEAARYLGATRNALGSGFARAFETWAESNEHARGRNAALNEALAFCRYALRDRTLTPEHAFISRLTAG